MAFGEVRGKTIGFRTKGLPFSSLTNHTFRKKWDIRLQPVESKRFKQVIHSCRKGFRSFLITVHRHNICSGNLRNCGTARTFQPDLGIDWSLSTCSMGFQPHGELVHLRRRQLLNGSFDFSNSTYKQKFRIASVKTSTGLLHYKREHWEFECLGP